MPAHVGPPTAFLSRAARGAGQATTSRWLWPVAGCRCASRGPGPLPSAPTSVTVYRDKAGHWWASFQRNVARKQKGSKNRAEAKRANAMASAKVATSARTSTTKPRMGSWPATAGSAARTWG